MRRAAEIHFDFPVDLFLFPVSGSGVFFLSLLPVRTPAICIISFLFIFSLKAGNLDSLLAVKEKQSGTEKIKTLNKIAIEYRKSDLSKSREYAQLALNEALQLNDNKGVGDAYNNMGNVFGYEGNYEEAIGQFLKSFLYRQKIADSAGMANCLSNIGVMYRKMDDFDKAFEYYQKALALKERLGNKLEVLNTLNNIGGLFYYQHNYKKSREYYERALKIALEKGDSLYLGAEFNNIGLILDEEKKYDEAESYFNRSLAIREKIQDEPGIAVVLNNMGRVYEHRQQLDKALDFYTRAAALYERENDLPDFANSLYNIGNIYLQKQKYQQALGYFQRSEKLAGQFSNRLQLRDLHNRLGIAYHYMGNHNASYFHLMRYIELNDSIYDEISLEKITEMEIKYQTEKKQQENEFLKQQNELKDLQHEKTVQDQRLVRIYFICGIFVLFSLALLMFFRFRAKKKSAQQLQSYNTEILRQKSLVDEKNKEITDSIHYAKKIQSAILPADSWFENKLGNSFVLFRPRDIVSGDFYWLSEKKDCFFFAAVDCTGHGVPGGFMSMLGSSMLDEIVNEKDIYDPADILDLMRAKIIQALRQTGAEGENKDGMDMALCRLEKSGEQLVYAGANNDLYHVRNGALKVFEASAQPVGIYMGEPRQFFQHEIKLCAGDAFYIFTDGYADQFGGPKGKKFKYKQLQELICSVQKEEMSRQKEALASAFDAWKGHLEQVDDVCIIGVRV